MIICLPLSFLQAGCLSSHPTNSVKALKAWLSVWGEVQICIWPSWSHCHSLSLAPGYPDWFWFYLSGTGSAG